MNLESANARLLELFNEYEGKAKDLSKLEYTYEMRYSDLYLQSKMGTAALKEAEVRLILHEEKIGSDVADLKGEVRRLYYKQQVLMEYCKNLRALQMVQKDE